MKPWRSPSPEVRSSKPRVTKKKPPSRNGGQRSACVCRQISVGGAYTYLGKDIGFDFNDLKGPVGNITHDILGSGLIPTELIPQIQQLLTPVMGADWFLTLQDRSLGFVGGQVTLPIYMGGKINTANRARENQRKDCSRAGKPKPQRAGFGARGAILRSGAGPTGRRSTPAGSGWSRPTSEGCRSPSNRTV